DRGDPDADVAPAPGGPGESPRGRAPLARRAHEPRAVGGRGRAGGILLVQPGPAGEARRASAPAASRGRQRERALPAARRRLVPRRPHLVRRLRRDLALAVPLRNALPRALLAQRRALGGALAPPERRPARPDRRLEGSLRSRRARDARGARPRP